MTGKILFFNADSGEGIIITAEKQKLNFNIQEWNDFDVMPSLGLKVYFTLEQNTLKDISTQEEKKEEKHRVEEIEEVQEVQEEKIQKEEKLKEEFFDKEPNIDEILEDAEEPLPQREESVTVTLNVYKAIDNYFKVIEENIEKRKFYTKVDGKLDYLLIRRFLWTIFNNLCEIDLHILTPQIKALAIDLKAMASVYDDFTLKTKQPKLAYEEVFLSCQAEYMKIKKGTELTVERIKKLQGNEKFVGSARKIKKKVLDESINSEEFQLLQNELKSLNGAYVDTIHMMAELDERYKHDMQLLNEFEKEYRDDFYELFNEAAKKYKTNFIEILSAQAFILDNKLWGKAKVSKVVKAHFQKASIIGEFNTRTYLKYYLKSFTSENMSEETQKLANLYEYLCSLHKEYVLIVVSDSQDAMEYESTLHSLDKDIPSSSFIDETKALKWAIRNSVKILLVEDQLIKMRIETFLKNYKKHVISAPQIIVLGEKPKTQEFPITKLLNKSTAPMLIAKHIQELYHEGNKTKKEKLHE